MTELFPTSESRPRLLLVHLRALTDRSAPNAGLDRLNYFVHTLTSLGNQFAQIRISTFPKPQQATLRGILDGVTVLAENDHSHDSNEQLVNLTEVVAAFVVQFNQILWPVSMVTLYALPVADDPGSWCHSCSRQTATPLLLQRLLKFPLAPVVVLSPQR